MKQRQFEAACGPDWSAFEELLAAQDGLRRPAIAYGECLRLYRRVCRDLALAEERGYSPQLVERLNRLAIRGHNLVYTRRSGFGAALRGFLLRDFPRLVRAQWRYVAVAAALFVLPGALVGLAVAVEPSSVYFVLSPEEARSYEEMYPAGEAVVGPGRDAGGDFLMFGYYIAHNIGIGFQCFASGVLLGLGTVFYLVSNGLAIGSVAAHLTAQGHGAVFYPFVIGHGAFELTAIVLAGAAGLMLGHALLRPGRQLRRDALVAAGRPAVRLVFGVVVMLTIAAFLEAFWSARTLVPGWARLSAGAVLWAFVLAYFTLFGRGVGAGEPGGGVRAPAAPR